MDEKLRKLMKHEGLNSTRLAEILGIQASGISHIMSGRNKPSYDFITKLLDRFPRINPDWLLSDKGPMYRDEVKAKNPAAGATATAHVNAGKQASHPDGLFSASLSFSSPQQTFERDDNDIIPSENPVSPAFPSSRTSQAPPVSTVQTPVVSPIPHNLTPAASIERIVVFYKDKTFTEYQPG